MSSSYRAFKKVLLNEVRIAKRVPYGLLLGLGLPILLLVIYGSVPALHQRQKEFGNMSYFAISVPILIGFAVSATAFIAMPNNLVNYREQGVLRRLSVTPVPPMWLLAAQIIVNIGTALVGLVLLIGIGIFKYGLNRPGDIPGFMLSILLTISSLFAMGIWIAAVARNSGASRAYGALLFYAAIFLGGLWVPRQVMPAALLRFSDWSPLGASVAGIQNAMQGQFITGKAIICLVGYTVVFGYLAVRYFKWE